MWVLKRHDVVWPKRMQAHDLRGLLKVEVQFADVYGIR
jgi:hypothetical protein